MGEDENAEIESPASAIPPSLEAFIHNISADELLRAAANPALTEDLALSLLNRPGLSVEVLARLSKNGNVLKSRKVRLVLASHPHTPRQVSVR
jgi:hypothetical protein